MRLALVTKKSGQTKTPVFIWGFVGAGDGTRTHDILLGKQTLYQLSYTRIGQEYRPATKSSPEPIQSLLVRAADTTDGRFLIKIGQGQHSANSKFDPIISSPYTRVVPQGGVAQLGERYNRTVEVGGSSPPASTRWNDETPVRLDRGFLYCSSCCRKQLSGRLRHHLPAE